MQKTSKWSGSGNVNVWYHSNRFDDSADIHMRNAKKSPLVSPFPSYGNWFFLFISNGQFSATHEFLLPEECSDRSLHSWRYTWYWCYMVLVFIKRCRINFSLYSPLLTAQMSQTMKLFLHTPYLSWNTTSLCGLITFFLILLYLSIQKRFTRIAFATSCFRLY